MTSTANETSCVNPGPADVFIHRYVVLPSRQPGSIVGALSVVSESPTASVMLYSLVCSLLSPEVGTLVETWLVVRVLAEMANVHWSGDVLETPMLSDMIELPNTMITITYLPY